MKPRQTPVESISSTDRTSNKRYVTVAHSARDTGSLESKELDVMFKRREMLGPLADQEYVSSAEMETRAKEVGVSSRTLWDWLSKYRAHGLRGLAPRKRSDAGSYHKINSDMVELIRAIKLSNPDWPVRAVFEHATKLATERNLPLPSKWQVRQICHDISPVVKLIASNRDNEFRNHFRFTFPRQHSGVVYQIDHNRVDVLVRDMRSVKYQTASKEVRPWLTIVIDAASRRVIAYMLSYDQPNRHTVASVIRKALLAARGGIPQSIWVDNGKDLVSSHVSQLVEALEIELHICDPGQPQQRAILERFFGVLNSRLWSRLPGYVSSNTVDRNPTVKAELTIQDIEAALEAELANYNAEAHTSLDMSPNDFWDQNCHTLRVADPRLLDILLLEPTACKVIKEGIKYRGRKYWHADLAVLVSRSVLVRADTRYAAPDEIEIYHDGKWVCTAFALDSERARAVTPEDVREAKKRQRGAARSEVLDARASLKAIEDQIARQKTAATASIADSSTPVEAGSTQIDPPPAESRRPHSVTKREQSAQEDLLSLARRKPTAAQGEQEK